MFRMRALVLGFLQLGLLAGVQVKAQDDASLAVTGFKLTIETATGSTITTLTGTYPNPVLANPEVAHSHNIEIVFSVQKGGADFKPQQAMLVLVSEATGAAAYAVGKAKKDNSYSLAINAAAVEKQLGKQGGKFNARLVVGDPTASSSVDWDLGMLELLLSAAPGTDPADAVRTASFQPVNNLKPEIIHIFRQPDKRAPPTVSLAFTGLAFVPLVFAVLYVLTGVKVNFKGWPVDGTTSLAALVFHASIAAMLGLLLLFWLKLNLAQTLPLVIALGAIVALSGYFALSGIAASRLKKD